MKARILVLDDEESIRFSFHRFLSAEGYCVSTAGTYSEALAKINEMRFDLILADIVLSDGCGIDILHEIQQRILKTGVIIMTAYPSKETVDKCFQLQAMDYLIKPLRQQGLLSSVKNTLKSLEI